MALNGSVRGLWNPVAPAIIAVMWTSISFTTGCVGDTSLPELAPEPYSGPAIMLEAAADNHLIVMNAPTPGYVLLVDRIEQERGFREIFVTVRKPNPQFAYAQMMVTQRATTGVATKEPIRVYVRSLDHIESAGAYRFATGSDIRNP